MANRAGDASNLPLNLDLAGHDFAFMVPLIPESNVQRAIQELYPQERYAKRDAILLHKHGHGAFCRFRVSVPRGLVGVYALVVNGRICYIGECEDLGKRFNMGYGNISPRNCYVGGQVTNCKINRRVLEVSKSGRSVNLYFHPTSSRRQVEKQLITQFSPPWND